MIVASFGVGEGYQHPSGRWIGGYIYCQTCGGHLELYGDPEIAWIGRCRGSLFMPFYDADAFIKCPGSGWHIGIRETAFQVVEGESPALDVLIHLLASRPGYLVE